MKKIILGLMAGVMILGACGTKYGNKKAELKTLADSASYVLGIKTGEDFKNIKDQLPDFNYDVFIQAILQTINDSSAKPIIDMNTAQMIFMKFGQEQQAKALGKNQNEEKDFLEKNKTKPGVTTTNSGLQYEIVTEGTGVAPAKLEDTIVAHYKGTYLDGKQFDNSFERGTPWNAPLTETIQAWQEMMPMMKVGTKMKIYSPSALAYGERGGNKMMIFEMEILEVKPAKATKAKK